MTRSVQRPTLLATLAATLLLCTGCVWLRLLDLKEQFADFDRWIEVPAGPGIELRFRRPVLLADDLDTLMKARPSASATVDGQEVRAYAFTHQPADGGPDPAGAETSFVLLAGVTDGRVAFITLPPAVFRVIPRELALRAMRSLGGAQVDTRTRSASAPVDLTGVRTPLPDRGQLISLFGRPNRTMTVGADERLVWRYTLQAESLREDRQPVIAAMAFTFPPSGARPVRFHVNLGGMWLSLELPTPAAVP